MGRTTATWVRYMDYNFDYLMWHDNNFKTIQSFSLVQINHHRHGRQKEHTRFLAGLTTVLVIPRQIPWPSPAFFLPSNMLNEELYYQKNSRISFQGSEILSRGS